MCWKCAASREWIKLSPNNNKSHCYQNNKQMCARIVYIVHCKYVCVWWTLYSDCSCSCWESEKKYRILSTQKLDDIKMNGRSRWHIQSLIIAHQKRCGANTHIFSIVLYKYVSAYMLLTHYQRNWGISIAYVRPRCLILSTLIFQLDFMILSHRSAHHSTISRCKGLHFMPSETDSTQIQYQTLNRRITSVDL